jgi:putative transposase
VFEALRHALMPKAYLLNGPYADLKLDWPCFGWMERLLMDNGREFHAEAVVDALLNLGIACEFAGSRDPNDKPFIERFLRTLNYGFIHKLPGTTLDKIHKRVGFKAEDDATLTLRELDRLIHVWICNVYHLRPHRGLGWRAPLAVWNESAKVNPPQLKMNAADVDIEFCEVTESRLQKYGIDLNTFVYRSERLLTMGRMLPEKSKVNVKWPRHDVGYIWVWDVAAQEYFRVENKDTEYAGLTLEQAKAVQAAKSKNDPDNTMAMADANAVIRDQIEEAAKSKKLSVRRKGSKLDNQTSKDHREPPAASASPVPKMPDEAAPDARSVASSSDDLDDIEIDLPAVAKEV